MRRREATTARPEATTPRPEPVPPRLDSHAPRPERPATAAPAARAEPPAPARTEAAPTVVAPPRAESSPTPPTAAVDRRRDESSAPRTPAPSAPTAPAPATAAAPPAASPTPSTADASFDIGRLTLQVVVYSEIPAQRMVFIDGRRYGEGDKLDAETVVERITPEGAVLNRGGRRAVLSDRRR